MKEIQKREDNKWLLEMCSIPHSPSCVFDYLMLDQTLWLLHGSQASVLQMCVCPHTCVWLTASYFHGYSLDTGTDCSDFRRIFTQWALLKGNGPWFVATGDQHQSGPWHASSHHTCYTSATADSVVVCMPLDRGEEYLMNPMHIFIDVT